MSSVPEVCRDAFHSGCCSVESAGPSELMAPRALLALPEVPELMELPKLPKLPVRVSRLVGRAVAEAFVHLEPAERPYHENGSSAVGGAASGAAGEYKQDPLLSPSVVLQGVH